MKVIGITGGTGTGKTTALRVIEKMGGIGIDADKVYHDLLENSDKMKKELSHVFPGAVSGGEIDRRLLASIVFKSAFLLRVLNNLTHRYVIDEIKKMLVSAEKNGIKYAAVDAVELIESGCAALCDICIGVIAPKDVRVRRVMNREGVSEHYASMRVDGQKPDSYYKEKCDIIICNDFDTQAQFEARCAEIFNEILGE